jgi:hypothetical protein
MQTFARVGIVSGTVCGVAGVVRLALNVPGGLVFLCLGTVVLGATWFVTWASKDRGAG